MSDKKVRGETKFSNSNHPVNLEMMRKIPPEFAGKEMHHTSSKKWLQN